MLKQGIHDRIWFYDLEWVPDAVAARRLCNLPPEASEREAFELLWKHAGATEEKPMPFLKCLFSRVVSAAFLSRNIERSTTDGKTEVVFRLHAIPGDARDLAQRDEAYIIGKFLHFVGERKPQLIGYNSLQSDLRVLVQRAMVNDLDAKEFNLRPDKPWEGRDYYSDFGEWHVDLMRSIGGYRRDSAPTLNEMAKMCGFPGKLDIDGQQVADLWLAGDLEKIIAYNQIDALNTYLIWLRLTRFCGFFADGDYALEQENFHKFLTIEAEKEGCEHLKEFLIKWEYGKS